MDLQNFIKESLVQIEQGIKSANKELKEENASDRISYVISPSSDVRQDIDFDVAVSVSNENEVGGKAGISVFAIGAGVKNDNKTINQSVSRIKFKVSLHKTIG